MDRTSRAHDIVPRETPARETAGVGVVRAAAVLLRVSTMSATVCPACTIRYLDFAGRCRCQQVRP